MGNSITVQEQRHQVWKTGTVIAGGLSLLFGLLFWSQPDPFWVGILRLIAFIFFTLTVFGALKLLEGPLNITIHYTPDHLKLSYKMKEKNVQEEQFEQSSIQEFIHYTGDKPILNRYLQPHSATLMVRFNDEHRDLPLFEYGGRILYFDKNTLEQIQNFLNTQQEAFVQSKAE